MLCSDNLSADIGKIGKETIDFERKRRGNFLLKRHNSDREGILSIGIRVNEQPMLMGLINIAF